MLRSLALIPRVTERYERAISKKGSKHFILEREVWLWSEQQFEVGQNLTHRQLLQLSSQAVRLVSAEAMAVA